MPQPPTLDAKSSSVRATEYQLTNAFDDVFSSRVDAMIIIDLRKWQFATPLSKYMNDHI